MTFKSDIIKVFLIALLSTSCLCCLAQKLSPAEAEKLFAKKRYSAVYSYYQDLLKKDSLNTTLNYKMGVCYLNSRSQKEKAISFLKRALTKNDLGKQKQSEIYKLLGDAYYQVSNFDEAILNYEKYRKILQDTKDVSDDISKEIEMCKMANELKEIKEITSNLTDNKSAGKNNRKNLYTYNEGPASLTQSTSISLPLKKKISAKSHSDKAYFEEVQDAGHYIFKPDSKKTDTTDSKMETTIATSIDGQIILIYRDDNGDGNLYSSFLKGNEWMKPEKLSRNIINRSWEPNEFISTNGNELYFSSDRDGGFGGKDIYKCKKLSNGEWGKAINMGSMINTKYDEEAPYLYADGNTLYFSSNRNRKKKGAFDNFACAFSDSAGWSVPTNVGYPLFQTIESAASDTANISSLKDNCIATFVNQNKAPITVLKGKVIDINGNIPSYVEITVANNMTGEISAVYHTDAKTGKYAFIIPSGQNQNITYEAEGYLFHSENIDLGRDPNIYKQTKVIALEPISEGAQIKLNNIFFEGGKSSLSPASDIELNKLTSFLTNHPTARIEIAATIDKKSNSDYVKETEEKIQSLANFLCEKGIDKKNIKSEVYKKKKNKKSADVKSTEQKLQKLELKILAL